jgi:hypothetical protein
VKVGVDVGVDVATPPGGGGRPPSFPWHALSIDSRMPSPSVGFNGAVRFVWAGAEITKAGCGAIAVSSLD